MRERERLAAKRAHPGPGQPTKELRGGAIGANESASLLKPSQRSICIYGEEAAQPSCGRSGKI